MSRHVSAEKLARFREDDLRPAAIRRVAAHLRGCPACQAESDALAAVPGLLASAQLPPMPAHLAARIETALATESAQRAAYAAPAARPGRADRVPDSGTRPVPVTRTGRRPGSLRPRSPLSSPARRIVATAAVIAVIGGGGYALFAGFGRPVVRSASSVASGAAPRNFQKLSPGAAAPAASGSRFNAGGNLSGRAAPVTFGPDTSYQSGGHSGQFTPVQTATNYQPGQLGAQAAAAVAASRVPRPLVPGTSAAAPGTVRVFGGQSLSRLSGCVARVAGGASV